MIQFDLQLTEWLYGREYQVATSSNFWKWWKIIAMIMIIIMIMIFEHNKRKNVPSYVTGYIWQGTPGCNFFQLFLTPSQPQFTLTTPGISSKTFSNLKKKKKKEVRLQLFSSLFSLHLSNNSHAQQLTSSGKQKIIKRNASSKRSAFWSWIQQHKWKNENEMIIKASVQNKRF